ncbi:MAG: hypothetical protein M3Q44_04040 [bacterium]|nr:hypothetical protein [bacterium]
MELVELITPSGYKVYLKPYMNFGQKRDLQRMFVSRVRVDKEMQKADLDGSSVFDAEDAAVKIMVEKVVDQEGREYTNKDELLSLILSWQDSDAQPIYDKIEELTKAKQDSEKKESAI